MSLERSEMAAGGEAPEVRRKGGRIVQSRYLQFDKKNPKKPPGLSSSGVAQRKPEKAPGLSSSGVAQRRAEKAPGLPSSGGAQRKPEKTPGLRSSGVAQRKADKDDSSRSSSSNASLPSSRTKARSGLSWKHELSVGDHSSFNLTGFEKSTLQSTLLHEEKMKLPDLDISVINGKSDPKKSSYSKSASERDSEITKISRGTDEKTDPHDLMEELESETLLLTYLRIKTEKRVAKMEEKAEENLLTLYEKKQRQQEKLRKLKREILLENRQQNLSETLDKQIEALSPLAAVCEQFTEQYKSFAASLDATRHNLPTKNIHIAEDKQAYLDELEKQLKITQELLAEVMPNHSENSATALSSLKELKEVSQQLSEGLQRSFTDVQDLSFEVSKEVSLHNQYLCEENHGVDVVKHWYFN